jgi:hypothetical protein
MIDYKKIKAACDNNCRISEKFVDEFLLYFIAKNERLEEKIFRQLAGFGNVMTMMPESWARMLVSQLIVHKTFKKDGVAGGYIHHAEILRRNEEELEFFQFQIDHPWRFSFCTMENYLLHDVYEMKDAVSGETFIVYSPGISQTNTQAGGAIKFWFLLIGFNGECWQTYGPLVYFRGIQPFDLFFFAKQIKPEILFQTDVQEVIESNPIPFAMLFSGAELPVTYHKKDMLVFHKSEFHVKEFFPEKYEEDFIVEKKHPIFMLELKRWRSFPHFAKCFFHAKKNLFIITAMTERGYDSLISSLNKSGNEFPSGPEIRATPSMLHLAKRVLNVNVDMNPYEKHFAKKPSPEHQMEIDKINVFLKLLMDRLNKKKDYDIAELAEKAGIDIDNAEHIAESVIKKMSDDSWKR